MQQNSITQSELSEQDGIYSLHCKVPSEQACQYHDESGTILSDMCVDSVYFSSNRVDGALKTKAVIELKQHPFSSEVLLFPRTLELSEATDILSGGNVTEVYASEELTWLDPALGNGDFILGENIFHAVRVADDEGQPTDKFEGSITIEEDFAMDMTCSLLPVTHNPLTGSIIEGIAPVNP